MEAGDHGDVRQYGGYGGFVECCEGVVDPILLLGIIAGKRTIAVNCVAKMDVR